MSLACALVLIAIISPGSAHAAGIVDTWDGTSDTGWYDASNPQLKYTITTAEQLAGLAELVDDGTDFAGTSISLDADLDLSGHEWESIGSYRENTDFSGSFDGRGHVISGLTQTNACMECGLFASVRSTSEAGASLSNIRLENVSIDIAQPSADSNAGFRFGALATYASNRVGMDNLGVVRIVNCSTSGVLTNSASGGGDTGGDMGGILGFANQGVQIVGCSSSISISSALTTVDPFTGVQMGGIVGSWGNATDDDLVADCYFTGSFSSTAEGTIVGGIVGVGSMYPSSAPVTNCFALSSGVTLGENMLFAPITISFPADDGTLKVSGCLWRSEDEPAIYGADPATESVTAPADQSPYGHAVTNFSDSALVNELNTRASQDITWAQGVNGHPVLGWQTYLAAANYSAVDTALAKIPDDLSGYTAESAAAVEAARDAVGRALTAERQTEVDAMAEAIEEAVAELEKLANYDAVDAAIAKAEALERSRYTEDSLAALDAALADVTRGLGETRQTEVDDMANAIEAALTALEEAPDPSPAPEPQPKPSADATEGDPLPATGDFMALLIPVLTLAGTGIVSAGYALVRKR